MVLTRIDIIVLTEDIIDHLGGIIVLGIIGCGITQCGLDIGTGLGIIAQYISEEVLFS